MNNFDEITALRQITEKALRLLSSDGGKYELSVVEFPTQWATGGSELIIRILADKKAIIQQSVILLANQPYAKESKLQTWRQLTTELLAWGVQKCEDVIRERDRGTFPLF